MSVRKGEGMGLLSTARAFALAEPLCLCAPQTMTDVVGNPEEERRAEFYFQPWAQEAVCRYFYSKVSVPEQGSLSVPVPPWGAQWWGKVAVASRSQFELTLSQLAPVLTGCSGAAPPECVNAATRLLLQVQQRRQELEQALGIRNT